MTRAPQFFHVFQIRPPFEAMTSVLGGKGLHQFGPFFHFALANAVKLKEECGQYRQIHLGIAVYGLDLFVIQKLDAASPAPN